MVEAYPLNWPAGWTRTEYPEHSRFGEWNKKPSVHKGSVFVQDELRKLGVENVVISTNFPLRSDGLPYSSRKEPEDSGVAVYFVREGKEQCIPCDKWNKVGCNLRAIGKTIEALRGLERWGAKEMVDASFSGFKALPSPDMVVDLPERRAWHEVLGVSSDSPLEVRKAAYRVLAKQKHPDGGGSEREWEELNRAREEAGL